MNKILINSVKFWSSGAGFEGVHTIFTLKCLRTSNVINNRKAIEDEDVFFIKERKVTTGLTKEIEKV